MALRGNELAIQRCTVHKHRNLLGHAPKHMHEELTADYRYMIYADTAKEVEKRRKAFLRKWRLNRKLLRKDQVRKDQGIQGDSNAIR